MPVPNNVREAAKKASERIAAARGDQGFGGLGPWPGESTHESAEYICDVKQKAEFENVVFKYEEGSGAGKVEKQRPAYRVQFSYVATSKIDKATGQAVALPEPFEFSGQPMTIPFDFEGLPATKGENNVLWRAQNSEGILKGHLLGITNVTDPNAAIDLFNTLDAVEGMVNAAITSNSSVQARVFVEHRPYIVKKNGPNKGQTAYGKQDFIRERLSN